MPVKWIKCKENDVVQGECRRNWQSCPPRLQIPSRSLMGQGKPLGLEEVKFIGSMAGVWNCIPVARAVFTSSSSSDSDSVWESSTTNWLEI